MLKNGLKQSTEYQCLFYKRDGEKYIYCVVHVDDMIIVSSSEEFEKKYMKEIAKDIHIKDLGEARSVLGM